MPRLRLDDDERDLLRGLHPLLAPHFQAIADDATSSFAEADRARLRGALIDWMSTRLLERTPLPVELGLRAHDVFVVVTAVRSAYVAHISSALPSEQAFACVDAINRLLDSELSVMACAEQRTALKTLSSGLAHELRNPLNSAQLQLDVLVRRLRRRLNEPDIVEPAELAQHEVQRLTRLVRDFLAYAQPSTLAMAISDLGTIVEHVLELERGLADERRVELVLVPNGQRIYARVDADKVHQVIENLVRNAIEAAPTGGRVEVRVSLEDDRVHLCVGDDGPGIPDAVRARIYEPFFSTKDNGTGLGMSIVKSLVALHGGTIDVASSAAGTRFDIMLPRAA